MNQVIQRAGDTPAAYLDGTLLMMNIEKGQYFSLNAVGTRIWELLEQPTSPHTIVDRLVAEYEVTEDVCARQLGAFLERLRTQGLLLDVA